MEYKLIELNKGIDIVNGNVIHSSYDTIAVLNNNELIGLVLEKDNGIKLISNLADNKKELKKLLNKRGSKPVIVNISSRYEVIEGEGLELNFISACIISHYGIDKIHRLYIDQYGEYWYEIIDSLMKTSELLKYKKMIKKLKREVMVVV